MSPRVLKPKIRKLTKVSKAHTYNLEVPMNQS